MLTSKQKRTIREQINEDRMIFATDGTVTFKRSYFYRHGYSPEIFADRLVSELKSIGFNAAPVELKDAYANWPRTSYFVARLRLTPIAA